MKRKVANRLAELGYIGEANRILNNASFHETGTTRQLTKGILYCMIDIAVTLREIREAIAEDSKETILDAH